MTEFEALRAPRIHRAETAKLRPLDSLVRPRTGLPLEISDTWSLADIGIKDIAAHKLELDQRAARFSSALRALAPTPSAFELDRVLDHLAALCEGRERLERFVRNRFNSNTTNSEWSAEKKQTDEYLGEVDKKVLEFRLYFRELPAAIAGELAEISRYRPFLVQELRLAPHILSRAEERRLIEQFSKELKQHHDEYTASDAAFKPVVRGSAVSRHELREMFRGRDAQLRREAYRAFFDLPEKEEQRLFGIFRDTVLFWRREQFDRRGFATPLDGTALQWGLSAAEVREALAQARQAAPIFEDVRALRAERLGVPRLTRFDMFVPPHELSTRIGYEQGVRFVHATFAEISPVLSNAFALIVNARHIDAAQRPGKRNLGYCSYPSVEVLPYLFLNWNGTPDDLMTLAHEGGHGVHGVLAARRGNQLTYEAPTPVMESAAMFAQLRAAERCLAPLNGKLREDYGFRMLEALEAMLVRQSLIVEFELRAHEMIPAGAGPAELRGEYLKLARQAYGPNLEIDPLFGKEYLRIPHLFLNQPFYCASYVLAAMTALTWHAEMVRDRSGAVPELVYRLGQGDSGNTAGLLSSLKQSASDTEKLRYDGTWLRALDHFSSALGLATFGN